MVTVSDQKMEALEDIEIIREHAEQRDYSYNEIIPRNKANGSKKICYIDGEVYHIVYRGLVNDIVKGKAPIIVVNGNKRSGKSVVAMAIAYTLHNRINVCGGSWNPETNLCYDVIEYMDVIRDQIREAIILDEAGKNLNSKDWYSALNRANDITLETMGIMNHTHIYVSTKFSDLDSSIKKRDCYHITEHKKKENTFRVHKRIVDTSSKNFDLKSREFLGNLKINKSDLPPVDVIKGYRTKELKYKLTEHKKVRDKAYKEQKEEDEESKADTW